MDAVWISRLEQMKAAHAVALAELAKPDVLADRQRYAGVARRASELSEAAAIHDEYLTAAQDEREAHELLDGTTDADEREFYGSALEDARARLGKLEARASELLQPRDPRDDRPLIVEIRAGAGGDEAGLFAADLLRMYQRYAERQGWRSETLEASESGVGGVKEVVFEVKGKGAFSKLRHESGVHRVQRVPSTESAGRLHTSTATVAVLPEADEVSVDVREEDLRIDKYRSSGPGGQHVNTTDSAIRITHHPSGIVVTCQSERSQLQNRERAMRILRAKLQEQADADAHRQLASERKDQVGTGRRAERMRTYNFPQNRVTDHRVGLSVHGIAQVMDGDIDEIVETVGRRLEGQGAE